MTSAVRRSRSVLVVLVAVVVTVMISAESAGAQAAETTVRVSVVGGSVGNSASAEIEVTVTSSRALSGRLDVVSRAPDGGNVTFVVPVEVAAGAVVTVPLSVPVRWGELDVRAALVVDGDTVAEDSDRRFFGDGNETRVQVGLLGVTTDDARLPLAVGDGVATPVTLTSDRLLLTGLDNYSAVVASPAAIAAADGVVRQTLFGFVASGGDLLVAGPAGSADAALPQDGAGAYGLGRVRYVGDDWASQLTPTAVHVANSFDNGFAIIGEEPGDPTIDLAADAGVQLPDIGGLGWLLLAYATIAGPVVYLVLRRMRRSALAWVVLPVVALGFTAGGLLVGSELRSDRGNSHVTVVEVWPEGSTATSSALFTATAGTERSVRLPVGWSYRGTASVFQNTSTPIEVAPRRDGADVSFSLAVGGAATARFSGPASSYDGALTIDGLRRSGDEVSGTVTNRSGADLSNVLAMFGTRVLELDDLADGESLDFSIDHSSTFAGRPRELDRWPSRFDNFGRRMSADEDVSTGAWSSWRADAGWNAFSPGVVGVVGWTRDLDSPVAGVQSGRTALLARANLPEPVGTGNPLNVVGDGGVGGFQQLNGGFFGLTFVSRIDVPSSLAASDVEVVVGPNTSTLEWFVDGEWRPVELPEGEVRMQPPSQSVVDGHIWARVQVPEWTWPVRNDLSAVVGSSGDELELLEVGDLRPRLDFGEGFEPGFRPAEVSEIFEIEIEPGDIVEFEGDIFAAEYDEYVLPLEEGDEVTLTLSAFHDSFLAVRNPDGVQFAENDDFPQCCDSGLTFVARSTGAYVIEARALGDSGSGAYLLTVERLSP